MFSSAAGSTLRQQLTIGTGTVTQHLCSSTIRIRHAWGGGGGGYGEQKGPKREKYFDLPDQMK